MDRRSRKTLAAIHDAFTSLLAEKPYEKITVTEIARAADIDRKTFYLHYESIDALFDSLLQEDIESLRAATSEVSLDENGSVNVLELFNQIESYLAETVDSRKALLRYADIDNVLTRLEPMLVKSFTEKDSLKLAEKLGPYLDIFVSFFISGLLTMYKRYLEHNSALPLEDLAAMTSAALTGGIAALDKIAPNYVTKQDEN